MFEDMVVSIALFLAARHHTCYNCHEQILPGEKFYLTHAVVWEDLNGRHEWEKMHFECFTAHLYAGNDGPYFYETPSPRGMVTVMDELPEYQVDCWGFAWKDGICIHRHRKCSIDDIIGG